MTHSKTIAALAIALVMTAATTASADLIAAAGSGQAGTDFANITPTVTLELSQAIYDNDGAGYSMNNPANMFDGNNGTYAHWGAYYWNTSSWMSVVIDFGQEVQVERIEALWTSHNTSYLIPQSEFRADSNTGTLIQNISFTDTTGSLVGYPNSTITDTGTLASPVTLSKLVLYAPPGAIHGSYGFKSASWNELNITGQVPEPATMGLLAFGGLGMLLRRKRK